MARKKGPSGARLGRPTRSMQEAINLALAGDTAGAKKMLKEDPRNSEEAFNQYLATRQAKGLGAYEFTRKRGGSRSASVAADGIISMIDGRTNTRTLVLLQAKVEDLLASRPTDEVNEAHESLDRLVELRRKAEEAQREYEKAKADAGI